MTLDLAILNRRPTSRVDSPPRRAISIASSSGWAQTVQSVTGHLAKSGAGGVRAWETQSTPAPEQNDGDSASAPSTLVFTYAAVRNRLNADGIGIANPARTRILKYTTPYCTVFWVCPKYLTSTPILSP